MNDQRVTKLFLVGIQRLPPSRSTLIDRLSGAPHPGDQPRQSPALLAAFETGPPPGPVSAFSSGFGRNVLPFAV
ncbi:MAG: hypothetical protein CL434_11570 [Acidimicrobiaceae bacterium]|jgi:hypothetical protein|nr:hypothetical protein [Acidimicrobiaceae bacterium]